MIQGYMMFDLSRCENNVIVGMATINGWILYIAQTTLTMCVVNKNKRH